MSYKDIKERKRFIISREIANEFEKVYTFKEQISRTPTEEVTSIVDKYNLEVDIAKAVYLVVLEEKMTIEDAVEYFTWLRNLYEKEGIPILKLPTYLLNFAAKEGTWLSYLYGKFPKDFLEKTRELVNLESDVVENKNPPIEKIVNIVNLRDKFVDDYIAPLIQKWVTEHDGLKSIYAAQALAAPLIKVKPQDSLSYLTQARKQLRQFYFKLDTLTELEELVEEGIITKKRILDIRKELLKPLDKLEISILSQVFMQIIPRKKPIKISEGKSDILIVSSPITRDGLVGPELKTPYDFLEMYLKIASRQRGETRQNLLAEKIKKVFITLSDKFNDPIKAGTRIIVNMRKRFHLKSISPKTIERILLEKIFGKSSFEKIYEETKQQLINQYKTEKVQKSEILERIKIKQKISNDDVIKVLISYFDEVI
ncbi:MAG: hypothetical protein ACTSYR_03320 [Candidatus Odinarchaeia archaeon]